MVRRCHPDRTSSQICKTRSGNKNQTLLRPGHTYHSKIEWIGETDVAINREDYDPLQPSMGGNNGNASDPVIEMVAGYQHQDFQYFARVPIDSPTIAPKIGIGGQARVSTGYRSIGYRIWWWFNQNFRA